MLGQVIGYNSKEEVIQNLKDAGCGPDTIACFMRCWDQGDVKGQFRVMEEHRRCLLDKVHEEERKIECLDYLDYQMRRNKNGL